MPVNVSPLLGAREWRIGGMTFSFLYLAMRALFGALVRSRRGLHVKGHRAVGATTRARDPARQVAQPKLRLADRAPVAAAACHLPHSSREVRLGSLRPSRAGHPLRPEPRPKRIFISEFQVEGGHAPFHSDAETVAAWPNRGGESNRSFDTLHAVASRRARSRISARSCRRPAATAASHSSSPRLSLTYVAASPYCGENSS
jgi:hypothetical protein